MNPHQFEDDISRDSNSPAGDNLDDSLSSSGSHRRRPRSSINTIPLSVAYGALPDSSNVHEVDARRVSPAHSPRRSVGPASPDFSRPIGFLANPQSPTPPPSQPFESAQARYAALKEKKAMQPPQPPHQRVRGQGPGFITSPPVPSAASMPGTTVGPATAMHLAGGLGGAPATGSNPPPLRRRLPPNPRSRSASLEPQQAPPARTYAAGPSSGLGSLQEGEEGDVQVDEAMTVRAAAGKKERGKSPLERLSETAVKVTGQVAYVLKEGAKQLGALATVQEEPQQPVQSEEESYDYGIEDKYVREGSDEQGEPVGGQTRLKAKLRRKSRNADKAFKPTREDDDEDEDEEEEEEEQDDGDDDEFIEGETAAQKQQRRKRKAMRDADKPYKPSSDQEYASDEDDLNDRGKKRGKVRPPGQLPTYDPVPRPKKRKSTKRGKRGGNDEVEEVQEQEPASYEQRSAPQRSQATQQRVAPNLVVVNPLIRQQSIPPQDLVLTRDDPPRASSNSARASSVQPRAPSVQPRAPSMPPAHSSSAYRPNLPREDTQASSFDRDDIENNILREEDEEEDEETTTGNAEDDIVQAVAPRHTHRHTFAGSVGSFVRTYVVNPIKFILQWVSYFGKALLSLLGTVPRNVWTWIPIALAGLYVLSWFIPFSPRGVDNPESTSVSSWWSNQPHIAVPADPLAFQQVLDRLASLENAVPGTVSSIASSSKTTVDDRVAKLQERIRTLEIQLETKLEAQVEEKLEKMKKQLSDAQVATANRLDIIAKELSEQKSEFLMESDIEAKLGSKVQELRHEIDKVARPDAELKASVVALSDHIAASQEITREALEAGKKADRELAERVSKLTAAQKIRTTDGRDVNALIDSAIDSLTSKVVADHTLRPNYALLANGARAIPILTSETYGVSKGYVLSRIFGKITLSKGHGPNTALDPHVSIGACWSFPGSHGSLGIALSRRIYVDEVGVDHPPSSVLQRNDTTPKTFNVWGLVEGKKNTEIVQKHVSDGNMPEYSLASDGRPPITDRPAPLQSGAFYHLGTFDYDITSSRPLQSFPMSQWAFDNKVDFGTILLTIDSNYGSDLFTCLYRVRVHGEQSSE